MRACVCVCVCVCETDRQTGRQTDRQTGRQANRDESIKNKTLNCPIFRLRTTVGRDVRVIIMSGQSLKDAFSEKGRQVGGTWNVPVYTYFSTPLPPPPPRHSTQSCPVQSETCWLHLLWDRLYTVLWLISLTPHLDTDDSYLTLDSWPTDLLPGSQPSGGEV